LKIILEKHRKTTQLLMMSGLTPIKCSSRSAKNHGSLGHPSSVLYVTTLGKSLDLDSFDSRRLNNSGL